MLIHSHDSNSLGEVTVVPEVIDYINRRDCDFRICTSCGGPILLPIQLKPPKKTDLLLKAGNHIIYVSVHQIRFLSSIHMDMIPFFDDRDPERSERG